ncbi:Conserved_hypothetical protein [Hexamita inflata]|uniref:Uncharacterized protein n=1 Tax=Hexamita inflata TaxID=28002 RepID=A0AA86P0P2_9EUKA|nr:Conserved hypothetical protein [Hexamita inflata]
MFSVPKELTHNQFEAEAQTIHKEIKLKEPDYLKVQKQYKPPNSDNIDLFSMTSVKTFLDLIPDDYNSEKINITQQLQLNQTKRLTAADIRRDLINRMRNDGIDVVHIYYPERLQLYLNSAPPQDSLLVSTIQKALTNVDKKVLNLKFHLEIKAQLEHIYDSEALLYQKLQKKDYQAQQQNQFNFKDFVTKKLMNTLYSKNSPMIGRFTYSTIGNNLCDFHKPRYSNEFAVFRVSCADIRNDIMNEPNLNDDFSIRNLYACEGRTVLFEHLEPFPLGVSLPGMGFQIQLKSAISKESIDMFQNRFTPSVQTNDQTEDQGDETNSQASLQSIQSRMTGTTAVTNLKTQTVQKPHKRTMFPPIPQENTEPHCLFVKSQFQRIMKMFFAGPYSHQTQPFLEGSQGIMPFWSYGQQNRFLLVRNRNQSIKSSQGSVIKNKSVHLSHSSWQLRKLPLVFSCGQLIPRAEFAVRGTKQKVDTQLKAPKQTLMDVNTYIQSRFQLLQSTCETENFQKVKKYISSIQINRTFKADKQMKVDRDYTLTLKILATENQMASGQYIDKFHKFCNDKEHLRRVLVIKEQYQKDNLYLPGVFQLDRYIGWQQLLYSLMTDRRLVNWTRLKQEQNDGKSWNMVDERTYTAFGNKDSAFQYDQQLLIQPIRSIIQNQIFTDQISHNKITDSYQERDFFVDPFKRGQIVLCNSIFESQDVQTAMLIWCRSINPESYVKKPDVNIWAERMQQTIKYDNTFVDMQEKKERYPDYLLNEEMVTQLVNRIGFDTTKLVFDKNQELFIPVNNQGNSMGDRLSMLKQKTPLEVGLMLYQMLKQEAVEDKLKADDDLYAAIMYFTFMNKQAQFQLFSQQNDVMYTLIKQCDLLRSYEWNDNQRFMARNGSFQYTQGCFNLEKARDQLDKKYYKINFFKVNEILRNRILKLDNIHEILVKYETQSLLSQIYTFEEMEALLQADNINGGNHKKPQKDAQHSITFTHKDQQYRGIIPLTTAIEQVKILTNYERKILDFLTYYSKMNETQPLAPCHPRLVASCKFVGPQNPGNYNTVSADTSGSEIIPGLNGCELAFNRLSNQYEVQNLNLQLTVRSKEEQYVQQAEQDLMLNPLPEIQKLDANVFREFKKKVGDVLSVREAKEQMFQSYPEVFTQEIPYLDIPSKELYKKKTEYKCQGLIFLTQIKEIYTKPPRKEGMYIISQFIQDVMTCIVAVLVPWLKPYETIPAEYFIDEASLFGALYEPDKKEVQTVTNRSFGINSFFGACYQLLLNLRSWFSMNQDLIERAAISFVLKDISKYEMINLKEEEKVDERDFRFTAACAYAKGWMKVFDDTINQDIVLYVKRLQAEGGIANNGIVMEWNEVEE